MEWATKQGYTVIRELGSGGEGHIYLCEKDGKAVVLKVVPELNEGQIDILNQVNSLKSSYFPYIHDIINNAGNTYILREYIEGSTLYEELKKNGCFSYARAKQVFFELCDALEALHNTKPEPIIHRDLKPENIIITPHGNVRLIDFGIARSYKPDAIRDTVLAGTDGYTAPEVRAGFQSDRRSDIYSLGMLLYEMLSGKSILEPPFQIRPLHENNLYLPRKLDGIIAKAVNPQQILRYQTVAEFKSAVGFLRNENPRRNRGPLLYSIYGMLAALIILASFYFLFVQNWPVPNTDACERDYTGQSMDTVCSELLEYDVYPVVYGVVDGDYSKDSIISQTLKDDGSMIFEVCVGPETENVEFADLALEQVVRVALGIGVNEPVSSKEMASLVVLNAENRDVSDLSGLEYAVNLTTLIVDNNNISDLTPIENLGKLTELRFNKNDISDLSAISRLRNLKLLHFQENKIADIAALEGMDLYDVEMGGNIISDISPISGCGNIVYLTIWDNQISDISALSGMKNLSRLLASGNLISNIDALSGLEALSYLEIEGNTVTDLSPLSSCRYLSFLNCRSNYVIDISPLSGLSYLSDLNLRGNNINDISVLSNLAELSSLDLSEISALDYSPLLACPGLEQVTIDRGSANEELLGQLTENGVSVTYID